MAGVALAMFIPMRAKDEPERSPLRELEHDLHSSIAFGVLPLFGTITQHAGLMTDYSGGTSTEAFKRDFNRLVADPEVSAIVIETNSPGGSVYGVEELSKVIYDARESGTHTIHLATTHPDTLTHRIQESLRPVQHAQAKDSSDQLLQVTSGWTKIPP